MDWLNEIRRRLWMLVRHRQFDVDLEDEMRLHLELKAQELVRAGLTPEDARYAALRRFGNTTLLKEKSHMAWGWEWLEHLVQDMNYGVRAMLRSPGITIVALLSLALGIGANTAIFNLIDAVMLRALPVKEPGRLLLFGDASDCCISDYFPNQVLYSYPFYREMQQKNQHPGGAFAEYLMREWGSLKQGFKQREGANVTEMQIANRWFSALSPSIPTVAAGCTTQPHLCVIAPGPCTFVRHFFMPEGITRSSEAFDQQTSRG